MNSLRLLEPYFGENLENAMRRFFAPAPFAADPPQLKMRIDVTENGDAYTVKADIPGVKKEDISVRVEGNLVSIEAQANVEKDEKGDTGTVLRSERHYGSITRSFSLGHDVDASKVQAKYADGVLTLELPKASGTESRRIAVQ